MNSSFSQLQTQQDDGLDDVFVIADSSYSSWNPVLLMPSFDSAFDFMLDHVANIMFFWYEAPTPADDDAGLLYRAMMEEGELEVDAAAESATASASDSASDSASASAHSARRHHDVETASASAHERHHSKNAARPSKPASADVSEDEERASAPIFHHASLLSIFSDGFNPTHSEHNNGIK